MEALLHKRDIESGRGVEASCRSPGRTGGNTVRFGLGCGVVPHITRPQPYSSPQRRQVVVARPCCFAYAGYACVSPHPI